VTAEFNDDERKVLRNLADVLEQFKLLRSNIPLHQVIMLLELALDEGKSQKFYSDHLELQPSTVSRGFLDLGQKLRNGEEGFGLVEHRVSAHSLREHEMFVSPKGRSMLQRIIKRLSK
jgi:DNA-binding MarR family transcriptional regulator